jgi:predicted ABC-type ATPase
VGLLSDAQGLRVLNGVVAFGAVAINSYLASVLADFVRHKLLAAHISFTFETVMSSHSKVAFFQRAQQEGYRTYLYFVATEDPDINVARVQNRVREGGHSVPEDKIRTRYVRSLDFLFEAVSYADRAYIFDNSSSLDERVWVAEVTNGTEIEMKTDAMPAWFKSALWDKFE